MLQGPYHLQGTLSGLQGNPGTDTANLHRPGGLRADRTPLQPLIYHQISDDHKEARYKWITSERLRISCELENLSQALASWPGRWATCIHLNKAYYVPFKGIIWLGDIP